jgi:hypothetical protein
VRGTAAAKLKVVLERTDTIINQAELILEASTADEAWQIILNDLEVNAGSPVHFERVAFSARSKFVDMDKTFATSTKLLVNAFICIRNCCPLRMATNW